jgi:type IV pilus assembly protein PilB
MAVRRGRRRGADETPVVRTPPPVTSVLDAAPAANGSSTNGASTNGASTNGSSSNGAKANGRAAVATAPAAAPTGRARLGDLLIERESITWVQLEEALLEQTKSGVRLGEILVAAGALDENQLAEVLASQFQLPLADLRRERPDPDALKAISESVARGLQVVPLRRVDGVLEMLVADPARPDLRQELERTTKSKVAFFVAAPSEVRLVIDQSYRALAGVAEHIKEFEITSSARVTQEAVATAVDVNAPVVQVVNAIITQALRDRASDVHIEPQGDQMRVRVRIDGALHDTLTLPGDMGPALVSRIKVMGGMNIVERRRAQDGQIETTVDGRALDIRVASTPVIFGEKVVLRLLDKSKPLYRFDDLGMPPSTHEIFAELVRSPFGMVICAGPTGSGKTTTLYATLGELDTNERNVMTIEDPVEYILPTVNQIQINEAADVTFAGGLKSILRQDPDVILVGEIRDIETARIAVQSALTGHFVLSSLHATDAASALHRFLDMGIEPFLIAPAVLAVVGQRLVRRICNHCRAEYVPTADELAFYRSIGGAEKDRFVQGEGCNFCSGTGYQERVGVYEVLRMTERMRELMVQDPVHSQMRELAIEEGMSPLRAQALRLVEHDLTTIPEILRSVYPL